MAPRPHPPQCAAVHSPVTHFSAPAQSYIDFEINDGQRARTRALYERLLDRTRHVKVWISFAEFEAAPLPQPETDPAADPPLANGNAAEEAPASREAHARR